MKILVTGGAGFMGSNFIKYILEKYPDYKIINLDKLTYAGNLDNLQDVEKNPNYTFFQGDIAKSDDVANAIGSGVDAIINYAAETHVDRSILDPRAFLDTDIYGTYTLLEATRAEKAGKMIQISTDEVFGMVRSEKEEFAEDTRFDPSSPYSAAKAGGDLMCNAYFRTYKTPVIVTHSCNFYGPNQYPEKLIPLFVTNLLEDKKIPVYGQGDQFREWIFVSDHCRAIDAILHRGIPGEVYNIGTRQRKSNLEITKSILQHLGKSEDQIEYVADRPGHDFGYAVNPDKLMRELQWKPEIDFIDGLAQTIEWYKNNEAWWMKIKSGEYRAYFEKNYSKRNESLKLK